MIPADDTSATSVVERFLTANKSLDVEGMFAEIDENAVWRFPAGPAGAPPEVRGKSVNRTFFESIRPMWKTFDLTFTEVHALADDPERVIAFYASSGSLIDGSPYRNTYLSLVRVSKGKIVEWIEFCDPEPLKRGAAVLQAAATPGGDGD
jgi:ketosteroid isomerase-like protein